MSNVLEVCRGERFAFGRNWAKFLRQLTDERIAMARDSLKFWLGDESLVGTTFLDVGSGSGLFSLVARQLGATVCSFDYDPDSVRCTTSLRSSHFPDRNGWVVESGSVLDKGYLASLGHYDIVYSWGVLHHTGAMYDALANVVPLVNPGGRLFIAIYNDQGWISCYWHAVKRLYNRGVLMRIAMIVMHAPYLFGLRYLVRKLRRNVAIERGMSLWYDMLDWLGGYPFEVARPEDIITFCQEQGFTLERLRTCYGRHGCNEFLFRRS